MRARLKTAVATGIIVLAVVLSACSSSSSDADRFATPPAPSPTGAVVQPGDTGASVPGSGPTIAAVGDLVCGFGTKPPPHHAPASNHGTCEPEKVSHLVKAGNYDAFLPLGDLQYTYGGYWRYAKYWDRYYGSLKSITRPAIGNHEGYNDFSGYTRYFGTKQAHMPGAYAHYRPGDKPQRVTGYYSYNLGDWHMISINSQLCINKMWNVKTGWTNPIPGGGCGPGSPEYNWLKRDLAAHSNADYPCTLAYFHHPLWKITTYGTDDDGGQKPIYDLLYKAGADVLLTGHQHDYQRWVPQDPDGNADPNGLAQFIVGTGGDSYQPLPDQSEWPDNLAAAQTGSYGIEEMTLKPTGYDFTFIPGADQPDFQDSGSAECH